MKPTTKNIIIGVLILAVIIAIVWLLPPRPLFAILLILQIITLLAIGGTNININANGNHADVKGNGNLNKTDHERQKRKHPTPEKKKHKDLQPWLDYFEMLHVNVESGLLQMSVAKHEAFVTQPDIHAMSEGDDPAKQIEDGSIINTAHRIFTYAVWLSGEGNGYRHKPFAVHVVKPDEPHDMIYTILFTRVLRFLRWKEKVEIINYPSK